MSTDRQRDADLDRLLRATLRGDTRQPDDTCPDAGVLASIVEGGVSASERTAIESHIARCGRCQEVLAAMDLGAPASPAASLAEAVRAPKSWLWRGHLHWLIPVTAATILVIYVASRPAIAPSVAPLLVEPESTQALAVPAERERSVEARRGGENEAARATGGVEPGGTPPPAAPSGAQAIPKKGEPDRTAAAPVAAAAAPARGDKGAALAKPEASIEANVAAGAEPSQKAAIPATAQAPATLPVAAPPGVLAEQVAGEARIVAAGAAPRPAVPAPPDAARPAARAEQTAADAKMVSAGAASERQPAMRVATIGTAPPSVIEVSAPGGTVAWRVGPRGAIWRSADEGHTWYAQKSGVSVALLAAAAPSVTTCWAVGASGTVLLTDDGERWERRPFPEKSGLVAVEASSSHEATVTTRDGRRFTTSDRGVTWVLQRQRPL